MLLIRCSLLLSILLTGQSGWANAPIAPRVQIVDGILEGVATPGLMMFKGVPFAAPPLGRLRWHEPQPVKPWNGVRKADAFAARCMQRPVFSDMVFRSSGISEDCLYLNIWTATTDASARQPVLVYFYGGGFIAGDGSEYRYDGASMARRGITTVTVNYRLDIFGMLAHPQLTKGSAHHASGNYGLLDQAAALRWVRANIAAFGGDPSKVTIAGESAGSMSVSALMASPLSKDLIAGAIGESGAVRFPLMALAKGEKVGEDFANAAGAKSLTELRRIPASTLLELSGREGAPRPTIIRDGYFFPKDPRQIFAAGEQAHVPLLAGSNSQEAWYTAILGKDAPTPENYANALKQQFVEQNAARLLQLYPGTTSEEVQQSATELASDMFLGYRTWNWLEMHGNSGGKPTFYYYYSRPRPATVAEPNAARPVGAAHSAEIEYALGNLATNKVYAWTPEDYQVSQTMQGYFANFIRTGDPNGVGLPRWDAYNRGDAHPRMTIDVNSHLEPDTRRARYELLKEILEPQTPTE